MPDLLLELFSEEIPARMQNGAAKDLERLVTGALSDRGLLFEGIRAFAGPRRLTLSVTGLAAMQPDVSEERKGPRVGAPEKAIEGFLRAAGVTLDQCITQTDAKGAFYVAVIRRAGRATADVIAEILPVILAQFPWPKSMRWLAGPVRWVRPLHRIVCTFDGEVVPFEFAGVKSGSTTFGHRFLSHGAIEVRHFEDYERKLARAQVILDSAQRRETITHEAAQKAFALGLEPIEDPALLEEVAGLAEWPVVLIGTIEDQFLGLPPEALQTSMRVHQKYFALRDRETGALANRFVVVANLAADDGGKEIVAGNERVLRARLSDARFFWDQDRSRPLSARLPELGIVVFHAKVGTMLDRSFRIAALATLLARELRFDTRKSCRAALLAKADLLTGMVGEFPELQGVMGRHYALHDGEDESVAAAIRDHYLPLGPSDRVPEAPVSIAVALADKIDSLVALWHAGEKPTGSRDPFALRRAGLGIIRIVLANKLRLALPFHVVMSLLRARTTPEWTQCFRAANNDVHEQVSIESLASACSETKTRDDDALVAEVFAFLAERLKVALREEGVRHDLIDAVFSLGSEQDFVRLVARVEALSKFLETEDGANLLTAYRRAANILRIEEKRDGRSYYGEPEPDRLAVLEEKQLFAALEQARERIATELAREHFPEAMSIMAGLRKPVDLFFDKVTVNAPEAELRRNRLLMLSRLRSVMHAVADFSRIEG
jgi:glycyl-tRNA synthetase beta chain